MIDKKKKSINRPTNVCGVAPFHWSKFLKFSSAIMGVLASAVFPGGGAAKTEEKSATKKIAPKKKKRNARKYSLSLRGINILHHDDSASMYRISSLMSSPFRAK